MKIAKVPRSLEHCTQQLSYRGELEGSLVPPTVSDQNWTEGLETKLLVPLLVPSNLYSPQSNTSHTLTSYAG